MPLAWNDDESWILKTEQPVHGCASPYVGNGRLGLRLGALILGTDLHAPKLISAQAGESRVGTPPFDHSHPLEAYAAHARDEFLYCLPSWADLDLQVGETRFQPQELTTSSVRPLASSLDLRTGEAGIEGHWRCAYEMVDLKIRLLIPRSCPHGAFWELELDQLKRPAEITFGLRGNHLSKLLAQTYRLQDGYIFGTGKTHRRGRTLGFGLGWDIEGEASVKPSVEENAALVRVRTSGTSIKLRVYFTVRGGTENWNEAEVPQTLSFLRRGCEDGSLRAENERLWKDIWAVAPDVTALPLDPRDRRFLLAQAFYLLASYDGSSHPTAPLGLSHNAWWGQLLWDTDFWHFRALNAFWPNLAKQVVKARLAILPGARKHAAALGLKGAWYGWVCDEEGTEIAPTHYQCEIHVNAWIALAAWDSTGRGRDLEWLKQIYPMIAGIADGVCSRAERDSDDSWHLRRVVPPDESVTENPLNPGTCDDAVSTNLAFRTCLQAAVSAAKILGETAPALWSEVAEGLVLLPPGPDGIIPEYQNYSGHNVKQADLILAFWPLQGNYPKEIVRTNLEYYREKIPGGPLMTEQIEACIRFRYHLGPKEKVLRNLIQQYRRYVRGIFEVPYECVDNTNSLMLTACGGLIQAITFGWFEATAEDEVAKVPRLGCK
ncbi:MAG: hypothetical protein LV479_07785 [Methylacidiphilales bacterium]|nr:hypothetical protein [Candidatus Methylacidiphilales bacterium]